MVDSKSLIFDCYIKLLAICVQYAGAYGLRYNVKKSALLVFQPPGHQVTHVPPLFIEGVSIPRVSRFKYLGHWVLEDQSDHEDIKREPSVGCPM